MSLEVHKLSLTKANQPLLDCISIQLESGQFHAIIGPNGAGKSLLLRCLAGWEQPDGGRVTLDANPVRETPPATLAKRRAVVGQENEPAFNFSALGIVALGRTADPKLGFSKPDTGVELEALRRVGLEGKASQLFATLSGGERQRVHLARALVQLDLIHPHSPTKSRNGSRWLLVDEPTNALDLHQQHRMLTLLRDFCQISGVGVCAILHDLNLASAYADQIWALKRGRLLASGPPSEVCTPATLGQLFDLQVHRRTPDRPWPECFQAQLPPDSSSDQTADSAVKPTTPDPG